MKNLSGRAALLTGASGGLAPFIAKSLAAEGVRLVLSGRNRGALDQLAAELPDARVILADLADSGDVKRLARQASEVDILVSNASLLAPGRLRTLSPADVERAVDVNFRAPILLAKLLSDVMIARGRGHIVLMASIAGKMVSPDYPLYSATKFGIRGLGLALRADLKDSGIGVSLVSPTFVSEAGMWAVAQQKAHFMAGEVEPQEVGEAVVKAIRSNRLEINVMPLATRLSTRLAVALPEVAMPIAEKTGAGRVHEQGLERQRLKEMATNARTQR